MKLDVLNNDPQFRRRPGPDGRRLPPWLRKRLPGGGVMAETRRLLNRLELPTVCTDARCPNLPECWSKRVATFMIMGHHCTRRCHYCAVETARPGPLQDDEPERIAAAAAQMGLRHVVITSVARDDLPDEGADHFARCVRAVRDRLPEAFTEVLVPDMHARTECIRTVLDARPTIFNHNIETVRRLTPVIRPQARYDRSLDVLRIARGLLSPSPSQGEGRGEGLPRRFTKSGLMVGLGESTDEVLQTLTDLRSVGCDILTIGQYLAPTDRSAPVQRYYPPEEFDALAEQARALGFVSVASGPFVRSSYNAAEVYRQASG